MAEQDEAIVSRLDTIIAIMQLAFKEPIDAARNQILADPVAAAILERTAAGWVDAGELKAAVSKETKQSERTISRRIARLIGGRALEQSGAGPKTRYRSSGLI